MLRAAGREEQGWVSAKRTKVPVQPRVQERRQIDSRWRSGPGLLSGYSADFNGGGKRRPEGHSSMNLTSGKDVAILRERQHGATGDAVTLAL